MLKIAACIMTGSCVFLSASEPSTDTPYSFLPSSDPYAPSGSHLFVFAEWLYWQANETGLSYALNNPDFDITDDTIMGSGYAAQPKFDWRSGTRLGIGYTFPHDQWESSLAWTWYTGQATDSQTSTGEIPTILPIFIHPNLYNPGAIAACLSGDSNLFLHLNVLDLGLGKQVKLSKALSIRPHVGIRSAWLNQNYNINYTQLFEKGGSIVLDEYSTNISNDFWGIGMLGGFGSQWDLKWGISFFGDVALSLLYGFFDTSIAESFITPSGHGNLVVSNTNNFRAGRAIVDLQLGLRYTSPCIKDRCMIVLQGGWEQHMYFSQNQIMHFTDAQSWGNFVQNQGDVDFQGLSLGASLYF